VEEVDGVEVVGLGAVTGHTHHQHEVHEPMSGIAGTVQAVQCDLGEAALDVMFMRCIRPRPPLGSTGPAFTAADPAGPWSDGISIEGIDGTDPDLAWDEQARAYVTYSGPYLDVKTSVVAGPSLGIRQARVNRVAGTGLEQPRTLWSGTGGSAPEGPHLYQRGGWWYLFIAEAERDAATPSAAPAASVPTSGKGGRPRPRPGPGSTSRTWLPHSSASTTSSQLSFPR
jgi:Glycosyl hydrolases family 43